jgi:predicted nucleic acid-binding protein
LYVVDATVWVSRFIPADHHHQPSLRWLRVVRKELILGPAVLLPEIGGPVPLITGRLQAAIRTVSLVQRLPNVRLFLVHHYFARISANLAAELRLRGADALYVALASRMGIPLVTWDSQQLQRGSVAANTVTPEELLSRTIPPAAG